MRGQPRQLAAVEEDATRARLHQADHRLQHRGLARAIAAEQAKDLARPDLQVQPAQDLDISIEAVDAGEPQGGHEPR